MRNPVFFDASGRRRRIVNVGGSILLLITSVLAVLGYLKLNETTELGDSGQLWTSPLGVVAAPDARPRGRIQLRSTILGSRGHSDAISGAKRFAFFDPLNLTANASLRRHANSLDAILSTSVALPGHGPLIRRLDKGLERNLIKTIRNIAPTLEIYPVLSSQSTEAELMASLADTRRRKEIIDNVRSYVSEMNYAGLLLELRPVPDSSFGSLAEFVGDLSAVLQADRRQLLVSTEMTTTKPQLQELARIADHVVARTDEAIADDGVATAPAAQVQFERQLFDYMRTVPAEKLIVTIGAYAIDASKGSPANRISVRSAWDIVEQSSGSTRFDPATLNSYFRYVDGFGALHDLWILDAVTNYNQVRAAAQIAPAGLAVWSLGYEDPSIWPVISKGAVPDAVALKAIERIPAEFHVDPVTMESKIIKGGDPILEGSRHLEVDGGSGLIVGETIDTLPRGNNFNRFDVRDPKLLALTFDDGPDSRDTPRILDILAKKKVHATFFVIGQNALFNPDILKRTYAEGHDIGNHTFAHPRLSTVPPWRVRYELNATQQALEFILGIHTRLFRPPFGAFPISDQVENVSVLQQVTDMGYTTVGGAVDGTDWLNPSWTAIHDRIVARVLAGHGPVVLLHDWGHRESTIEALPHIIDTLQAYGYRFATIHELLGKDRSAVMQPAVSDQAGVLQSGEAAGSYFSVAAYQKLGWLIAGLAIVVSVLNVSRLGFSFLGMLRHKSIERRQSGLSYWPRSVAVIVPAYNEEKVICKTITSLLAASRTDFEIIVVDDGSKDDTFGVVQRQFRDDPRVKVFRKPNGGKADAANFAMRQTDAEVVIAVDADGVLARNAIELMVRHFADPRVGAVAGMAVVGNQVNLLTKFQAIEYMFGQYVERRALTIFNANAVVPGAIGAWRREALLGVGGYATDTVAEDCDATFAVARAGWIVAFEPLAEARTEAPEDFWGFLKQRRRWMFGMLQVVSKNLGTLRHGPLALGWLTVPYVIVFGTFVSFATPILAVAFLAELSGQISAFSSSDPSVVSGMSTYLKWWVAFSILDFFVLVTVLKVAGFKSVFRQLPLIVLQRLIYMPVIYWVSIESVLSAIKGKIVGWNKLKRTGTVSALQGAEGPA